LTKVVNLSNKGHSRFGDLMKLRRWDALETVVSAASGRPRASDGRRLRGEARMDWRTSKILCPAAGTEDKFYVLNNRAIVGMAGDLRGSAFVFAQ
jgi:hypothetical protein